MVSDAELQETFVDRGWVRFPYDGELAKWAEAARVAGLNAAQDPQHDVWWQCGGTWFVGVDVLDNDAVGRVGGIGLSAALKHRIGALFGPMLALHKAQVSIIKQGYPKPREGESEAAFGYRLRRDAAHVDGLRLNRDTGARVCDEYHQYILGLPLNDASAEASPMVLWDRSHHIMGAALRTALEKVPDPQRPQTDISEPYKAARREVFETCPRLELAAKPGEAYVIHRHLLHGVAPWGAGASAAPEGRAIAYFRPEMPEGLGRWLTF